MKFLLYYLLSTCLNFSFAETPKTHMLILGGSGDPRGDSTIFDKGLGKIGEYYRSKQQRGELGQSSIAFDGGHTNTDAIKNSKFPSAEHIQNFTQSTYQSEVDRFKIMMTNNSVIKPGDQLLIYINTHGAAKDADSKTHKIVTGDESITDADSAEGASRVSVDQIAELQKIASANGVKLAIIDLSCHSGNTQNLADNKTCIISATGKNHYAYGGVGFNGTFSDNLKPGETLESAFLKTRSNDSAADYPMISTPEGKLINEELYNLLTPYLQYRGQTKGNSSFVAEKLSDDLMRAASDSQYACEKENSYEYLNKILDEIDKNTTVTKNAFFFEHKESIVDFDGLKKALKEYKDIQSQLTEQLKNMNVKNLQKKEPMDTNNSYTWAQLISTDWEKYVSTAQGILSDGKNLDGINLSEEERYNYQVNLNVFQNAFKAKKKILAENPHIMEYKNVVANFDQAQGKTEILAEKIATYEKKLYEGLYKKYSKENNTTNPCRDFKL